MLTMSLLSCMDLIFFTIHVCAIFLEKSSTRRKSSHMEPGILQLVNPLCFKKLREIGAVAREHIIEVEAKTSQSFFAGNVGKFTII